MTQYLNVVTLCFLLLWYREMAQASRVLSSQERELDARWRKFDDERKAFRRAKAEVSR